MSNKCYSPVWRSSAAPQRNKFIKFWSFEIKFWRLLRQLPVEGSGGPMYDAEYDAEEDDMADYSGYDDNDDDDYTHNVVGNSPEVVSCRTLHYSHYCLSSGAIT